MVYYGRKNTCYHRYSATPHGISLYGYAAKCDIPCAISGAPAKLMIAFLASLLADCFAGLGIVEESGVKPLTYPNGSAKHRRS